MAEGTNEARSLARPVLWSAAAVALVGAALYNWWVVAAFNHILPTPNMLFSDLEVEGGKYSHLFNSLDFVASALFLVALLAVGARGRRTEWITMLWFTSFGMTGAIFHYSCAEALSASCRSAEWHFRLPLTHYAHMLSGIGEFAAVILVVLMARRRHADTPSLWRAFNRAQTDLLIFALPLIAATYLLDRWEAAIEPILLVVASSQVIKSLLEPDTAPGEEVGISLDLLQVHQRPAVVEQDRRADQDRLAEQDH